jgi:hypothetical protein
LAEKKQKKFTLPLPNSKKRIICTEVRRQKEYRLKKVKSARRKAGHRPYGAVAGPYAPWQRQMANFKNFFGGRIL